MRDNTDQIPINNLRVRANDDRWKLLLQWRRKDKMREVLRDGSTLRVRFEDVQWGDGVWLWLVRGTNVYPWGHIPPATWSFVRKERVGAASKSIYEVSTQAPCASKFGLFIARPTVRSAIRQYTLSDIEEPPVNEEPEPASLFDTVAAVRGTYPEKITDNEAGAIINEVAWLHRDKGWGLARKDTGAHALQPTTDIPISRDLLVYRLTGRMYDALGNVSGGEGRPTWNPQPEDDKLPFVAPVPPLDAQSPDDGEDDEGGGENGPSEPDLEEVRRTLRFLGSEIQRLLELLT